jgi:hypothetical protein
MISQASRSKLEKEIEEHKEMFEQELIEIEKRLKDRCVNISNFFLFNLFVSCLQKCAKSLMCIVCPAPYILLYDFLIKFVISYLTIFLSP